MGCHTMVLQRNRTAGVRKILTATLAFCALSGAAWGEQTTNSKFPRIVSLAPSVTETLFAVGAGAQLVGIG